MKNQRILRVAFIILMFAIGLAIEWHYWTTDDLEGITQIPTFTLILTLVYILIQISKRYIFKNQNWWDWLYYLGLIAMMLPTVLANDSNASLFHILTDYGTLFLIIPIFFDGKQLINGKR